MGFIRRVWVMDGQRQLEIDYAEILSGQVAVQAAIADGLIQPGQALDNDYYIRNQNPQLRTFTVSAEVRVFRTEGATDNPISWSSFMEFWQSNTPEAQGMRAAPWWIERDESVVVEIRQQYLP